MNIIIDQEQIMRIPNCYEEPWIMCAVS